MDYIARDIEGEFLALCKEYPVVLVTGARQAGKTTMLEHHLEPGRKTVTLDDLEQRALAREDPELFLQAHQPPVFIDEVQYAPELFPYLKIYADSHPGEYESIWVSGSQSFKLMKLAGESLAGRVGIIRLLPLSQHEAYGSGSLPAFDLSFEGLRKRMPFFTPAELPQLYKRIWTGSMPAVISGRHSDPSRFYRSYQQTYIERDVRELDSAADMVDFSRFMAAAASQVSQLLNIESLARDVGVARRKAEEWLGIMERSDIIFFLRPYSNNALSRSVKTPKLYFNDTGLAAWLGRWSSPETLEAGAMGGALFENYVVSEVQKSLNNTGDAGTLWFYRDRDSREVDLVLERDGTLFPLEIKRSANPSSSATRSFSALKSSGLRLATGTIVCMKQEIAPISSESIYAPAWLM